MFRYGEKVFIRDGSLLEGAVGIVYRVTENLVSVLLDKEVIWHVAPENLEPMARVDRRFP